MKVFSPTGVLLILFVFQCAAAPTSFIDLETAPLHPVALGPDGRTLAVCNLPDNPVELFNVSSGVPTALDDVPGGVIRF